MHFKNTLITTSEGLFEGSSLEAEAGFITDLRLGKRLDTLPQGLVLIPGLIDLHGDMLERELEPRPGSRFPTPMTLKELDRRHTSAGLTTAYVALSFADFSKRSDGLSLAERLIDVVETLMLERPYLGTDMRVHARFEIMNPEAAPLLETMLGKHQVEMVSLMDHTPGQGQFRNLENYVEYMMKWLKVGRDDAQYELNRQLAQPRSWDIVHDICKLAKANHLPIASHDDDTHGKVSLMQELGVSISEFPVSLEAATSAKAKGMWTLMGAPNALRGGSHSGNLSAIAALEEGVLDLLASDYYPAAMLQACYQLSCLGVLPFHESLKLVSLHPAQAAGLTDRGCLEPGKRADMVLVHISDRPQVIASFVKGRLVYWNGHYADALGIEINSRQTQNI
ncbi:MAG: alpha-D-ribose 1-methylphosphonate 5-triphosphate diphosphatase [Trueperaceae bacterium]|nr:alpha-D-ribose 1-methylphosphonate 5-triphosphate diphosphatase [Trueperaceae bacterium]